MVEKENKKLCSICDAEIEEDNGDVVGLFGITPVAFCVWCMISIVDMVKQTHNLKEPE